MRSVPARVVVEPQLPLEEAQRIVLFVALGRCSEHSSSQGLSLLCMTTLTWILKAFFTSCSVSLFPVGDFQKPLRLFW